MKVHAGSLDAAGKRFAVLASRYNALVVDRLVVAAVDAFARHGAAADDVSVFWVPGAFDLPGVAKRLARTGTPYSAIVCLGCVIRGETPHFEYVAREAARGLGEVALHSEIPVIFGVLTTDTMDQALDRAGGKSGNKGWEAATAAIDMANLYASLPT